MTGKKNKCNAQSGMLQGSQKPSPMQINSLICKTAGQGDVSLLLQTIDANLGQLNMINMSTSFHRLAKLVTSTGFNVRSIASHPVVLALDSRARQALEQKEVVIASGTTHAGDDLARCLSTIAWSYATLMLHKPKNSGLRRTIGNAEERHGNFQVL